MTDRGFSLFDTAIGRCGIAWGRGGIVGLHLPEARESETRTRLRRRFPDARESRPPRAVQRAAGDITALLRGEARDLSGIALDMEGVPPFHQRVYEVARTIPVGGTLSYGEVAAKLGSPGSARAVGQALGRNPFAIVVPCHRVLSAGGKVGGFSANGGVVTKLKLLGIEGAHAPAALPRLEGGNELGWDPKAAIRHLRAADPALSRAIDAGGPFDLPIRSTASIFAALVEAIIYQQLSGKAAETIHARVCALFPRVGSGPTPRQILRVSDEKLRGAGVSRPKVQALRDLARRAADGTLPDLTLARRMDDEALVERLTAVRGIGRWTAEMLLIFRLGRPDVLPVDDLGIRSGFAAVFRKRGRPTREELEARGERWRPYRTVASLYLWRAAERAR